MVLFLTVHPIYLSFIECNHWACIIKVAVGVRQRARIGIKNSKDNGGLDCDGGLWLENFRPVHAQSMTVPTPK